MLTHALTIGTPEAAHINWESAAAFFERRMAAEIDLRANTWTRSKEYSRPGNHPLLNFVSCPPPSEN